MDVLFHEHDYHNENFDTAIYRPKDKNAVSFYLAASDRDVLMKVSDLLKSQGYVGFANTAGEIHYVIDARKNIYASVHHIQQLAESIQGYEINILDFDDSILKDSIDVVLNRIRIDKGLRGYQLLRYMLLLAVRDESIMRPVNKVLYPLVGEYFNMSPSQVDRTIRYATRAANIIEGNAALLLHLRDEVIKVYKKKKNKYS